jgi:signal transduction histidine kinase
MLRDEAYRIGREALSNAFRHSHAKKIAMNIHYTSGHLKILVRDDGCGIDSHVLVTGRDGHWGLSGMRERAERIGARFHVWSSPGAGTEIELSVPGAVAFQDHQNNTLAWVASLFQGRVRDQTKEQKVKDGAVK